MSSGGSIGMPELYRCVAGLDVEAVTRRPTKIVKREGIGGVHNIDRGDRIGGRDGRWRMTELRARGIRIPLIGALVGVGLVGILRRRRRRRPTGSQLMAMDERGFALFIESTGLKTVTTAGLEPTTAAND
jgi:hypothetical protein